MFKETFNFLSKITISIFLFSLGFSWCSPHSLLSTSKDCSLIHHVFASASRPAERANPVGLDINPYGDMSYAFKRIHHRDAALIAKEVALPTLKTTNFPAPKLPAFFKKSTSSQEKTKVEFSALSVLKNGHEAGISLPSAMNVVCMHHK